MKLTRDHLLRKRPRRTKQFTFPDDFGDLAGQSFTVQAMTARERSEFETQFSRKGKPIPERQREIRQRLVIATVIDDNGMPLFADDDLGQLSEVDGAVIEYMATASQELNQITNDDLEEIEKNSETTPAD